jgi:hypothetical protein
VNGIIGKVSDHQREGVGGIVGDGVEHKRPARWHGDMDLAVENIAVVPAN